MQDQNGVVLRAEMKVFRVMEGKKKLKFGSLVGLVLASTLSPK